MLVKTSPSRVRYENYNRIMPALIALTATAVAACSAQSVEMPSGFERDPLTAVRVLNDALNAQQFDGALDLFDDDVAITSAAGEKQYGKAPVMAWMRMRGRQHSDLRDIWMSGDTIVWTVSAGDQVIAKHEAVFKEGKIKSIQWLEPDD